MAADKTAVEKTAVDKMAANKVGADKMVADNMASVSLKIREIENLRTYEHVCRGDGTELEVLHRSLLELHVRVPHLVIMT